MKIKKLKLFLFALAVAIGTISLTNMPVSASDAEVVNQYLVLKSEYDLLKSKANIMRSAELSKELLDCQRKIDEFKNHIYEQKNMSVEELRHFNYNDDQIQAIKTYDGSEEKTVRASPTVTFTVKKDQLSYNSSTGLSTVRATVKFSWQGSPSEYGNDCFAMAYEADNNHNFKTISDVESSLNYVESQSTGSYIRTRTATKNGDQGVTGSYGWSFPFKVMGEKYYAFLSSGSFSTTGVVSGSLKYFNVRYMYSHKSFSISADFGISISSTGVGAGINLSPRTFYTAYPKDTGGVVTLE